MIDYFKQALKSDWMLCCSEGLSFAGEKMQFRVKIRSIREWLVLMIAKQIERIPCDFKMDVIKHKICTEMTPYLRCNFTLAFAKYLKLLT